MKRKIIKIDEKKCNGCGLCINACHEGALKLVDGKAKLISDIYCDGLGDCLPACPMDAIKIIEREAEEYNQEAVDALQNAKSSKKNNSMPCGCPGSMARKINVKSSKINKNQSSDIDINSQQKFKSELSQWPVQLKLVNPVSDYFNGADLLIAADCTAYAYGNFHKEFIKGRVTVIGCPKLDDNQYYIDKLTEIFTRNNIKSITVVRMEVPCCSGIVAAAKEAMLNSRTIVPYNEVVIGLNGEIK